MAAVVAIDHRDERRYAKRITVYAGEGQAS